MCEVNHFPFRFCSVMPCKMILVCVAGLACRRKKAYNRQQKLMAKFASKQKAFMAQAQDSEEGRGDCFSVVFRDTLLHTGMFPSQPFYFFPPPPPMQVVTVTLLSLMSLSVTVTLLSLMSL